MKTATAHGRRSVLRRLAIAGGAIALLATTFSPPAAAEDPPPPRPVFDGGDSLTPLPGMEEYAGCPLLNEGQFRFCISLTVNGHISLGKVGGDIENLRMVMAAAGGFSGDPVLVPAAGNAGPSEINVPGGILGIPELDPIIALDPINLIKLGATPTLGELQQTGLDQVITLGVLGFATYPNGAPIAAGDPPAPLPAAGEDLCVNFEGSPQCLFPYPTLGLGLPLDLKLNNLLLGTECNIGQIPLDLTTGTTSPPEGVAPLTGSSGSLAYNPLTGPGVNFHVNGIKFVGNSFGVPASNCGGVASLGDTLEGLGAGNPFEGVVNSQAGLPSPAGANTAELSVDLHVASQEAVYGAPVEVSPGPTIDFGNHSVGDVVNQDIVITNRRNTPRTISTQLIEYTGTDLSETANSCEAAPLAAGASCTISVTFAPTIPNDLISDLRIRVLDAAGVKDDPMQTDSVRLMAHTT